MKSLRIFDSNKLSGKFLSQEFYIMPNLDTLQLNII